MSAEETLLPLVYTPSLTAPTHPSGQSNEFKPSYCLSHWPSTNFILAAGTATFQPSTAKVVLIEDVSRRILGAPRERWVWFLPRGRKDQGETLEQCAVRETLEEVDTLKFLFHLSNLYSHYSGWVCCNSHTLAHSSAQGSRNWKTPHRGIPYPASSTTTPMPPSTGEYLKRGVVSCVLVSLYYPVRCCTG